MKKNFALLMVALLLLATAVSAQETEKMQMRVGGELGFSTGLGIFTYDNSIGMQTAGSFSYNAFDITPVFQFYPLKNKAIGNDLGFEVDARLAFGSNGYGTAFALSPDFLVMYYFNRVPYVTPFVGAGIGVDLTVFPYPTNYNATTFQFEDKTNVAFRFAFVLKAGLGYDIPNTKLQVYFADTFRFTIPAGWVDDVNLGVLYRL